MPTAGFGKKTSLDNQSEFVKLKSKGDKIHFRLANAPYYDGKHFLVDEMGDWQVSDCSRVMTDSECPTCQRYFELKKEAKEAKENGHLEVEKELNKKANKYAPKITFYYPVLDRGCGKARIFKTSLSVRLAIEEDFNSGIDVMKFDYVVSRMETNPQNYYSVVRLDSSDTKNLTKKEKEELAIAKAWDLTEKCTAKKSSSQLEADVKETIL